MFITRNGQVTAEDAAQIFGGRSLTQGGMGRIIENVRILFLVLSIWAILIANASIGARLNTMPFLEVLKVCPIYILEHSFINALADVLGDLGVRQAIKKMPPNVRL